MIEAISGDPHVAHGAGKELADDDGGVAGAALAGFGTGPDEVDPGDGTVGAFGDDDVEDDLYGARVEVGEAGEDGVADVGEALGLEVDRP